MTFDNYRQQSADLTFGKVEKEFKLLIGRWHRLLRYTLCSGSPFSEILHTVGRFIPIIEDYRLDYELKIGSDLIYEKETKSRLTNDAKIWKSNLIFFYSSIHFRFPKNCSPFLYYIVGCIIFQEKYDWMNGINFGPKIRLTLVLLFLFA